MNKVMRGIGLIGLLMLLFVFSGAAFAQDEATTVTQKNFSDLAINIMTFMGVIIFAQMLVIIVLVWRNTNLVPPQLFELVLKGGEALTKQIPGKLDDMVFQGVKEVATQYIHVPQPTPEIAPSPDKANVG